MSRGRVFAESAGDAGRIQPGMLIIMMMVDYQRDDDERHDAAHHRSE
jgi:hypothetical protein